MMSQTLHRTANRHEAEEDLTIDIDALEPGDYVLRITVRDVLSGRVVERRKGFTRERAL